VGAKAVVAAGTTVTKNVPPGALAIARAAQTAVAGYAEHVARRYGKGSETSAAKTGSAAAPAASSAGAAAPRRARAPRRRPTVSG